MLTISMITLIGTNAVCFEQLLSFLQTELTLHKMDRCQSRSKYVYTGVGWYGDQEGIPETHDDVLTVRR
jgi:hypothetical protein